MAVKTITRMIVLAGLLVAGTVLADVPKSGDPGPEAVPSGEIYNLDMLIADLDLANEMWVSATLENANDEAEQYRKDLIALINYDISVSEQLVRDLARDVALARIPSTAGDQVAASEQSEELSIAFDSASKRLNTKEALYRSITRTSAFSNQYRLLGDYIDLLRRELKMPRLKLAHSNRSSSTPPDTRPPTDEK